MNLPILPLQISDLTAALKSQSERADYLLRRKDELHALLIRIRLCRDLFEQLPADLRESIRDITGDLIQ
jgi:hypothetical protein